MLTEHDAVRTKRVKEARDEAKKEIEEYRSGKEQEFKTFQAEVRSNHHIPSSKIVRNPRVLSVY